MKCAEFDLMISAAVSQIILISRGHRVQSPQLASTISFLVQAKAIIGLAIASKFHANSPDFERSIL